MVVDAFEGTRILLDASRNCFSIASDSRMSGGNIHDYFSNVFCY